MSAFVVGAGAGVAGAGVAGAGVAGCSAVDVAVPVESTGLLESA
ncbi:MAG: hypothetical protein E6X65_06350 [Streptococcus mitis]|nr:hypothetical protein [Streptococcus mitis]